MKWSSKAWVAIEPIYKKILAEPFVRELMNGTLAEDKFIYYLQQDALYIRDYQRVLSGIASKLSDKKAMADYITLAKDSVVLEENLHHLLMKKFNVNLATSPSPTCLLYGSYLLRTLNYEPIEVALAATLPCFWVYHRVSTYIYEHQNKKNNPYQKWIDTYAEGGDFDKYVQMAIDRCDKIAEQCTLEQQKAMTEAFIMATKLDHRFWQKAYEKEQWTI